MTMSSNKTKLINNCVARYEENSTICEVMLTCMIVIAQAMTNAHLYKRTNDTLIEVAKLEKKSKSRQKKQNNKTKILNE